MININDIQVISDDRSKLEAAITVVSNLISSTMGPHPSNVTITGPNGGISINDGVKIIETLRSADPMVALAYDRMKRASQATHRETGDGTSSTAIIFANLFRECQGLISYKDSQEILARANEIIEMLKTVAMKVDDGSEASRMVLRSVANIAMHGHPWAHGIADLLSDLGVDGSFSVEISRTGAFSTEKLDGFRWQAGVVAPEFFNMRARLSLGECYVAVIAGEKADLSQISGVLNAYNSYHAKHPGTALPLVFVCQHLIGNALAALIRGQGDWSATRIPYYCLGVPQSPDQRNLLEDFAAVAGTKVFDTLTGNGPDKRGIELSDLGRVKRLTATDRLTTVIADDDEPRIERARMLTEMATGAAGDEEKLLRSRVANLLGAFGVIRIVVTTESEFDNLREMVEDGYRAVQSALAHGVLPGAGRALSAIAFNSGSEVPYSADVFFNICDCVATACGVPDHVIEDLRKEPFWMTYDILGEEMVDAVEAGILDNAGSVCSAIMNATKEVVLLMNTEYFIVNETTHGK